jgi:hypothetical protein
MEANPTPNCEECLEIQKKTRLSFSSIVLFFYRYHNCYQLRNEKRRIMSSSSSPHKRRKKNRKDEESIEYEESIEMEESQEIDEDDDEQSEEENEQMEKENKSRIRWNVELDSKLIEMVTKYLKIDGAGGFDYSNVDWEIIATQFSNSRISKNSCSNRWKKLLKITWAKQIVEVYMQQLEKDPNVDIRNIMNDLPSTYMNESGPIIQLPSTLKEFNEKFIKYVQNADKESPEWKTKASMIADSIKMIELSEEKEFSTSSAKKLLSVFEPSEIAQILQDMHSREILSKSKFNTKFRLKGFNLKKTIQSNVNHVEYLKPMIPEINSFNSDLDKLSLQHSLDSKESMMVNQNDLLNSGKVASILSKFSNNEIKLTPSILGVAPDPQQYEQKEKSTSILLQLSNSGTIIPGIDFLTGKIENEGFSLPEIQISLDPILDPNMIPKLPEMDEISREDLISGNTEDQYSKISYKDGEDIMGNIEGFPELKNLVHYLSNSSQPIDIDEIKTLYAEIKNSKQSGKLKSELKESFPNQLDLKLTYLCNFGLIFEINSFNQSIFFSEFFGSMFKFSPEEIELIPCEKTSPNEEPKNKKVCKYNEKESVPLSSFRNVATTNFNQSHIQTYRVALFEKVLFSPGIKKSDLLKFLVFFSPSDLDQIMNQLELDGLIKSTILVQSRPGLFGDSEIFTSSVEINDKKYFSEVSYETTQNSLNKFSI